MERNEDLWSIFEERLNLEFNQKIEDLQKSVMRQEKHQFNFYKVELNKKELDRF